MHPYLTRLGIDPAVQANFAPFYYRDTSGNLGFAYHGDCEVYGLGFHHVPVTDDAWIAGPENFALVRQAVICSSAMEAIAWLNCHFTAFHSMDNLLFISTGSRVTSTKLDWIRRSLSGCKYGLLFSNDLLGKVCDLKAAAGLKGYPVNIRNHSNTLLINFRHQHYELGHETFSLSAFEQVSGFRFGVQTFKPKRHNSWLDQLTDQSFNT
jgi:hypothetical protein